MLLHMDVENDMDKVSSKSDSWCGGYCSETFVRKTVDRYRILLLLSHIVNMCIAISFALRIPRCCGTLGQLPQTLLVCGVVGLCLSVINLGVLFRDMKIYDRELSLSHWVLSACYEIALGISFASAGGIKSNISIALSAFGAVSSVITFVWLFRKESKKWEDSFVCSPYFLLHYVSSIFMGMAALIGVYVILCAFLLAFYYDSTLQFFNTEIDFSGYTRASRLWIPVDSYGQDQRDYFDQCMENYNLSSTSSPSVGGWLKEYNMFVGNDTMNGYRGGCCEWHWNRD
jgi:hypothetical protein